MYKVTAKRYLVFLVMLFFFFSANLSSAQPGHKNVHAAFYKQIDQLLKEHVRNGQVNYKLLQKHPKQLSDILQQVSRYDLSKASVNEKKAFYINAYNLLVWQQVMQHYPLNSVMDVAGFFDKKKFNVAGEMLTLNELEKIKLMAAYKDARIHFALVCAAKSCPPLSDAAFKPATIESQLQAQATYTLQDQNFIKVDPRTKKVQVSEIFKWYEADFLKGAASIADYINQFRNVPLPSKSISYYAYDWTLNNRAN